MLLRCESLEPPMSRWGQNEKVSQQVSTGLYPESGRSFERRERQLRATSDHSHRNKQRRYSITSSAVESSVCDTVRPSIRAVRTLMASSNLAACTTGRSAHLAPLSKRPA